MSELDVVLGLQWGDEGKGKVVDVLTPGYKVIARFQGGPNAGHSLKFDGDGFVLHTVPSGIFRSDSMNIIGNGVVLDPVILMDEIKSIEEKAGDISGRLQISKRTQLILPTHRVLDAASEAAKGRSKIGSTLKGIGPAYMDKTGRNGLRVGDLLSKDFLQKYEALKLKHFGLLSQYDYSYDISRYESLWMQAVEEMKRFRFIDSEFVVNSYLDSDVPVLAEGAQGSMLDIDFGTYPFVTSSSTMAAGVCTGLGIAPCRVGKVMGIFKAYCTRVGSGPFPTELSDETGELLRRKGGEFGATTGRPRRCGWLDMVALKYAVMISGVNELIMMKADVLNDFDVIKVATAYSVEGRTVDHFPYECDEVTPVYTEFRGWKKDICTVREYDAFPQELKDYVSFIEKETRCPVRIISVGPDRNEIVVR